MEKELFGLSGIKSVSLNSRKVVLQGLESHDNAHRMCETFYVNDDGVCDIGFSSPKAGSECRVDSDC